MPQIRVGNQTAWSAPNPLDPFHFALNNGFDAFEWFSDKKIDERGIARGWEESDFNAQTRSEIKKLGRDRGMLYTVHAPWQANPLQTSGAELLKKSLDFGRDIDAKIVNLHLYMEQGAGDYIRAMIPVLHYAKQLQLRVSIENTPHTTPADFNQVFAQFWSSGQVEKNSLGMCLDIGHANLCATTRNDFIRYIDELSGNVPIIHLHVHENYGDRDSHLPLFTGPASTNDTGIRAFVNRMQKRNYVGAMILEQWPQPPTMLVQAANRLRSLIDSRL